MIWQKEITLPRFDRGYHLITHLIEQALSDIPQVGICNIFVKHSSAAISINENADPSVRQDFEAFMNHLIPENHPLYTHIYEGSDDMPAHLKSSLIGCNVNVPITKGRLNLGTWQGIYLCEFRDFPSPRKIVITIYG